MGDGMKEDKLFESVKRFLMKYEINLQEMDLLWASESSTGIIKKTHLN